MTAALARDAAKDCPVCGGDPSAVFQLAPWGFLDSAFARCPLCHMDEGCQQVWRRVLAPFLEEWA